MEGFGIRIAEPSGSVTNERGSVTNERAGTVDLMEIGCEDGN